MEKNPDERAKELWNKLKHRFTRSVVTIAVGNTEENISLVGTSENRMRKEITNSLEEHEIIAEPNENTHAEEDVVAMAKLLKLKLQAMGASRPICIDCEDLLKKNDIEPKTELSGKKSKKRK